MFFVDIPTSVKKSKSKIVAPSHEVNSVASNEKLSFPIRSSTEAKLVSGIGSYHTNEPDPNKPDKKLRPYDVITWSEILELVDNPQEVKKRQARWIIPSTLQSRNFFKQEAEGKFYILWSDLDDNQLCLRELAETIDNILDGADFELYTSKSATSEFLKMRLLVPLAMPISGKEWVLTQEILNDKLEAAGVIPDRASQGAAQLCYLPNRGEFYDSFSKRNGDWI